AFAVPTSTLIKEIHSLMSDGKYEGHSYLGVEGTDMTYDSAQQLGVGVTYGWIIRNVVSNGPSYNKLAANDIIIAMNETQIRNGDEFAGYLEENTLPQDTLNLKIMRKTGSNWQETYVAIVLGKRPEPNV
ncbi:MAG: PDZ domain-containing protein, partial [Candidatus Thorarchaeota archaeon]|nr:PDZ domain-containing protein [Candidatus Thorarchaeota archaeon]